MKIELLPRPTFSTTQTFIHGSAHPGYLIPVSHFAAAIIAEAAGTDANRVYWVLPTLVVPLMALTMAGLGRALLGTRVAGVLVAAAWVFAQLLIVTHPPFWIAGVAMWPGEICLYVVLPLLSAVWLNAVAPETEVFARRISLVLLGVFTLLVLALHASYAVWIAIPIGGYLLGWLLFGERPRANVTRYHAPAALAVAAPAGVGLWLLMGAAKRIGSNGDRGGASAADDFRFFHHVLVGHLHSYRLRSDYLVAYGGFPLLGLLGIVLMLRHPRRRVTWYVSVPAVLVLVVSQVPQLFTTFARVALISQAIRLGTVLQTEVGLAALVLAIGGLAGAGWASRATPSGRTRLTIAAVATAGGAFIVHAWGPLVWRFAHETMPGWPVVMLTVVGVGAVAALSIARAAGRAPGWMNLGSRDAAAALTRSGALSAGVALVVIASPLAVRGAIQLAHAAEHRPAGIASVDRLASLDPAVQRVLRAQKPGQVVLALPNDSFAVQGVAALYTTSYPKVNTANTRRNDRDQRIADTNQFFRTPRTNGGNLRRLSFLRKERVSFVLTERSTQYLRTAMFRRLFPGVLTPSQDGDLTVLYRVNGGLVERDQRALAGYLRRHSTSGLVDASLTPTVLPEPLPIAQTSLRMW
jgi:hypothetical protein